MARRMVVAGAAVLALGGAALGARRTTAQAQTAGGAPGPVGTFKLVALPGPGREWLVIDTRSGAVQHWAARDATYEVTALASLRWVISGAHRDPVRP